MIEICKVVFAFLVATAALGIFVNRILWKEEIKQGKCHWWGK
jgi:hypothetical protein